MVGSDRSASSPAKVTSGVATASRIVALLSGLVIALTFILTISPPYAYTHWSSWKDASRENLKLSLGEYAVMSSCHRINDILRASGLIELTLISEIGDKEWELAEASLHSTTMFWSRERAVARIDIETKIDAMNLASLPEWKEACTNWLAYRRKLSDVVSHVRL